jgi:fatty acid desaturase
MSGGRPQLFAHSSRDLWLVLLAVAGVALLPAAWWAWHYGGPLTIALLFLLQALLACTNYQCVAHNFVHHEFFRRGGLNHAFSVLNAVALGFPQSIFRQHHLNHHRFNNAPPHKGQVQGGDLSSLYRYSRRPGRPEGFLAYSLLSPLRADILHYAKAALRGRTGPRLIAEATTLIAVMAMMALTSSSFFLLYYLPLLYIAHVLTYAEGYFEHNRAVPGDRMRNSASCYGELYNLVWFNNGYHQEHHCHPQVHWTQIRPYRSRMLPESDRRVVRWAHCTNL